MSELIAQITSINLIKDLIIPAVAAWVGFFLAARKFRNERLWLEKYAAYQRLFEAVEAIRYWGCEAAAETYSSPTIGWFNGKSSSQFYAEARHELTKQASIGVILFPPAFMKELCAFRMELLEQHHDFAEDHHDNEREALSAFGNHAAKVRAIAEAYIPKLVKLTQEDLRA